MDKNFTIGKLAREAGVNIQTIRYYERLGLLTPTERRKTLHLQPGYRLYDQEALKRLRFIRHAKELGFTLKEINELLNLRIGSVTDCDIVRKQTEAKLRAVEQKIDALASVKMVLKELVERCIKRLPTEGCPILQSIEKGGEDHASKEKG